MKDIPFHPIADEYPTMPEHDLGRMEQGMRDHGYDPRFPIILYKKQILDGRNRWIASKRAGVKPTFATFKGTEEETRQFAQLANEERRHLVPEWLEMRRKERIARVAASRQEGQSTRQIAEAEGISQPQVRRDLEAATETGVSVQPAGGVVNSSDGIQRPATSRRQAVVDAIRTTEDLSIKCPTCTRRGPRPNCKECEAARKKARGREPGEDDAPAKRARAKPSTNGQPKYDWKKWDAIYGSFVREFDSVSRAYGDKESPEYCRADKALSEFCEKIQKWRERIAKS